MLSGQPLATSRNDVRGIYTERSFINRLIQVLIIGLLSATGFIHWYLPVVHPVDMPGEITGGIIAMSHDLLHLLFDLNGAGYFGLAALVAGWLPIWATCEKRRYLVVVGYAALTVLAWVLLSDPAERSVLDYLDKGIELAVIALALWMGHRISRSTDELGR